MAAEPDPIFFKDAAALREWLERNHESATELWVGLYRVGTGKAGLRWADIVDEALCFGWIDSVRRSIDDERYMNRITPRRRGSTWSAVNIRRVGELIAEGRMRPAGLAAFEARKQADGGAYSYEVSPELSAAFEAAFRENPAAWERFQRLPASYRRTATWWVTSAKREDTRRRRLAQLIAASERGERLPQFDRRR